MTLKQSTDQIKETMINEYDYLFCEHCKRSDKPLEFHHIMTKRDVPKHPELHNVLNLLLVCRECHDKYHGKIKGYFKHEMRKQLIIDRDLKQLFGGRE